MIDNLIRDATCRITCGDRSGTGYVVSKGKLLTARHCVRPSSDSNETISATFSVHAREVTVSASVAAESEDLDTCILDLRDSPEPTPIRLSADLPREGDNWRTFGFPMGKTQMGHRITGSIAQILDAPIQKLDIDLSVDSETTLQDYHGMSGGPVICAGRSIGLVRVKLNGSIGAVSVKSLAAFLKANQIEIEETGSEDPAQRDEHIADRAEFQAEFEELVLSNPGQYFFLQGAHGIGKTTFCRRFSSKTEKLLVLGTYSILEAGQSASAAYKAQPDVFFDWLSVLVSLLMTGRPPRKEPFSYTTLISSTETILQAFSAHCAAAKRHGILFIDGLNEAQQVDPSNRLLGLLPAQLPSDVTVVLTAPNYALLAAILGGRIKQQSILSLPSLTMEAAAAFCRRELRKDKVDASVVNRICQKAQGHPLYLRYLIDYLNRAPTGSDLEEFPTLGGPIEDYYECIWEKLATDSDATQLLGVVCRLRSAMSRADFLKALSGSEQTVFLSTFRRIQHLLSEDGSLAIYHSSFAEFLAAKTSEMDGRIHGRLFDFCGKETEIPYCRINLVFHGLHSEIARKIEAVRLCNQGWVDTCVELGSEPGQILTDVEQALAIVLSVGTAPEAIRILLLSQRVSFRYDFLFAQSAFLIANALIALGKPREALNHIVRSGSLLLSPLESLRMSFIFISHGFDDEAKQILDILNGKIIDRLLYQGETSFGTFIEISALHVWVFMIMRLIGRNTMNGVFSLLQNVRRVIEGNVPEAFENEMESMLLPVTTVPLVYFLCFRNTYSTVAQLRNMSTENKSLLDHQVLFQKIITSLLQVSKTTHSYRLSPRPKVLDEVFNDVGSLIKSGATLPDHLTLPVADILIVLGAPVELVERVCRRITPVDKIDFLDKNGVDVQIEKLFEGGMSWRIAAFTDETLVYPIAGELDSAHWFSSIEELARLIFFWEGRLRRAQSAKDNKLKVIALTGLKEFALKPLRFTLAQRVTWENSYAIPEGLVPVFYGQMLSVLIDCAAEELPAFLAALADHAADQCGLYTEGFRQLMLTIFEELSRCGIIRDLPEPALNLLHVWRDHVLGGVENRHELVPEILRLIPFFSEIGAKEEAERLHRHMLNVSMGPTWYKEDQLGIMTSALKSMTHCGNSGALLPQIAAALERASGEMTFQRFVRAEKSFLLGELIRLKKMGSACRYFREQSCGGITQLVSEWEQGSIDKPTPRNGYRFPGGALEEQQAMLQMVKNLEAADWHLPWALLEVFLWGDDRYVEDYAAQFARLINEVGTTSGVIAEMAGRMRLLFHCEIPTEHKKAFAKSLIENLESSKRGEFMSIVHNDIQPEQKSPALTPSTPSTETVETDDDGFYLPGTFGRRSALSNARAALLAAEEQLKLGNFAEAANHARRTLQLLQEGGWSIWNDGGTDPGRAEEIIRERAADASAALRLYAELVLNEGHIYRWRIADHLVCRLETLTTKEEAADVLKNVVEHIKMIVGETPALVSPFAYLSSPETIAPNEELFSFLVGLVDHPEWMRRDRAAVALAWLLRVNQDYLKYAAKRAFSQEGIYGPDILCGSLDMASLEAPKPVWDLIHSSLDLEEIIKNCKNVSRFAVLARIAKRGGDAGAATGTEVALRIEDLFRAGAIHLKSSTSERNLPHWAKCVVSEWRTLEENGFGSDEIWREVESRLTPMCQPLPIGEAYQLEAAVSTGFRQAQDASLNRWEGRVRAALNEALFSYSTGPQIEFIERTLRVYNPSMPDLILTPEFKPPGRTIWKQVQTNSSFQAAIGDEAYLYLNLHEIFEDFESGMHVQIEVVAVLLNVSVIRRGFFLPSIHSVFESRERPNSAITNSRNETCCHLRPRLSYLGAFTPAVPLQSFMSQVGTETSDFRRVAWQSGRSSEHSNAGRPGSEGCLLAVRRNCLKIPNEKKLAWILWANGKPVGMFDSESRRLF
jgi:hypothetical protein